jgi:hypothetical protein
MARVWKRQQHDWIRGAVQRFAEEIGCDPIIDGGKEFARLVMIAFSEAADEGGDVMDGVVKNILALDSERKKRRVLAQLRRIA